MAELDKKGAIYSDRPVLEMGGELVGYSETLVLLRYGPRFRTYRKHFSHYVGSPNPIKQLYPLIEHESRRFLKRTLAKPDDLMPHLRKYVCLYILKLFIFLDNTYVSKTCRRNNSKVDLRLSSTRRRRSLHQLDRKGQHQFQCCYGSRRLPCWLLPYPQTFTGMVSWRWLPADRAPLG